MSISTRSEPTLCRRCGQIAAGTAGNCTHCGSPLADSAVPVKHAVRERYADTVGHAAGRSALRSGPALVAPAPRLSRRHRRTIAAGGAALLVAVTAFLVLRPDPSPAGVVEDYFDHLGSGDTAAALSLVGGAFSVDEAPLLVPEVLAGSANRPSDVEVIATRPYGGDDRYSVVTGGYRIGEQAVEQDFGVYPTGDDETPYRLEQPFLPLVVELPDGLDVTVNGVPVDAATVTRGTPVFPGAYQATTTGNALFAGATQAATYTAGGRGVTAGIDLAQAGFAPGALEAVQAATERQLDASCAGEQRCPLQAPSLSWGQTTSWTITAYPQVQLSSAEPGQARVRFTTGTTG